MSGVALVHYDGDMKRALTEAVKLIGGFGALSSPVIIKPNLCADVDVTGVATTRVQTVEALLHLLLEQDGALAVRIVESDSESKEPRPLFRSWASPSWRRGLRRRASTWPWSTSARNPRR